MPQSLRSTGRPSFFFVSGFALFGASSLSRSLYPGAERHYLRLENTPSARAFGVFCFESQIPNGANDRCELGYTRPALDVSTRNACPYQTPAVRFVRLGESLDSQLRHRQLVRGPLPYRTRLDTKRLLRLKHARVCFSDAVWILLSGGCCRRHLLLVPWEMSGLQPQFGVSRKKPQLRFTS